MWSLSIVTTECSLSGRGQGHVINFYIVDLKNFATASCRYTGDIYNSVRSRFVYDTYKTMEATRSRHGWVHMFITHCPLVTLQLHSLTSFCSGLVIGLQVVSAQLRGNWQDLNWHDASRGPSAIAELLVLLSFPCLIRSRAAHFAYNCTLGQTLLTLYDQVSYDCEWTDVQY